MEKEEELKKAKKSHDHLEDRLNECEHTNEDLQRQFKEKDARYGEMESNLAAAAVTVETLRRTNDKLLGAEEANRKTISDQVEDQKRQAHQIYLLKQEKSQCLTMLEETKVSLLESEEEFAKKAEECESRRMSEEQLNSKLSARRELILHLQGELVERKDELQRLLVQMEATKFVDTVVISCLEREWRTNADHLNSCQVHIA
jgi:chromosome segregation ATPase